MSETIHDAAAAYALGVLDPEEAEAFETHLEGCERCRSEVASFEETVAAVGTGVPEVRPRAALRDRVLAAAHEAGGDAPTHPSPGAVPPAAAPDRPVVPWWGLAAAAVAALTTVGWWNARDRVMDFELQLTQLETEVQMRDNALAERDSLLAIALDLEARDARLVATDQPPSARIVWSPARSRVILTVADLVPAPEGRVYQLWGIPDGGAPVSLGVFNSRQDGSGVFILAVPDELDFAVSAVTEEPAGGSPQPTTTPFLVGAVGQE